MSMAFARLCDERIGRRRCFTERQSLCVVIQSTERKGKEREIVLDSVVITETVLDVVQREGRILHG